MGVTDFEPRRLHPGRGFRFPVIARFTHRPAMLETGNDSAILDDAGKTERITEVRRQEALLKTGALQNAILTSANFSIIATDEKGIIQLFNVGAERMLGYLAAEVVNRINPSDIHDPQEVMARAQALSLELATTITPGFEALAFKASRGIEDIYELTYICKDGSRFPAIVSITALRDDYGDIIGYLLIGTDNSVRKQVELELHDAMAVAEKANLAKSDFLSSMSHELRTPLSAILGFAQLMESGSPLPTPSQKRSIDQILKAGWYLLELINEILDLALIESGKLSLSLEPSSLAEVMHECQAMIEPQAQKRGISVTFPRFEIRYFVKADRTRVKQVLINLLSNAIKYNKVGGTVVVDCIASTPGRIRICVKDTGEGLTPDKLAQLFQPFNRLGQEANAEEGTGIGLVVCKRLVELMGGVIGVESTVGKGSVFWIELDLTAGATTRAPARPNPRPSPRRKSQADAQLRTLLYVEDNPANLMLVEDLIARRPDIRLLSARDGNRGIEIARASRPDVILMDINLPGISGIKALRILADDPATAHIPVIALSANAMPRDIEKGLEAGFFRYLTKPIKVNEFMDTLDVALKFAKAQSARADEERTGMMISAPDILDASILIVDDQESNVSLLEQLLSEAGYTRVASTMNPQEVCALHRKNRYDLILLDLQMPGMDGFQVMEGLKTNDADGYLPVIVLTAQPGHKLRALQAGAKDFISKPFDLVEVKTRIHNMLEVRLLYKKLENFNKVLEQTVQERTAELRESEARYRSLTELASDWYWEQDETGNFTKVSGPVLEMLGIRVDALAGERRDDEMTGWNETEREALQAKIAARQPFLDFVFSRVNADGSHQKFRVSGEPMFNQACRFIGYRGIGVELIARK